MVFLHEQCVPINKLLGFGSDGASALMGTEKGVATQLQRENPNDLFPRQMKTGVGDVI